MMAGEAQVSRQSSTKYINRNFRTVFINNRCHLLFICEFYLP